MTFFFSLYKYTELFWERVAVWIGFLLFILVGVGLLFYIPYLTEFMFSYGDVIREEILINLVLTMYIENMKEKWGMNRVVIIGGVYMAIKFSI